MEENENLLEDACRCGRVEELLEKYILFCYGGDEAEACDKDKKSSKKGKRRFPNVAGFCRYLFIGEGEYERLCAKYPYEFEKISMFFEDEALNSDVSPTILSAYLKRRLGYEKNRSSEICDGQMKIVFEHDIIEDGI